MCPVENAKGTCRISQGADTGGAGRGVSESQGPGHSRGTAEGWAGGWRVGVLGSRPSLLTAPTLPPLLSGWDQREEEQSHRCLAGCRPAAMENRSLSEGPDPHHKACRQRQKPLCAQQGENRGLQPTADFRFLIPDHHQLPPTRPPREQNSQATSPNRPLTLSHCCINPFLAAGGWHCPFGLPGRQGEKRHRNPQRPPLGTPTP